MSVSDDYIDVLRIVELINHVSGGIMSNADLERYVDLIETLPAENATRFAPAFRKCTNAYKTSTPSCVFVLFASS